MKKIGSELEFISRINRDGKGVTKVEDTSFLDDYTFETHCLSLSESTYIAIGFNSYVVKIKITPSLLKEV